MTFRSTGINPYANGAGIVLPESGALNDVINDVKQNGFLSRQNIRQNQANAAQTNKDFATNKLAVSPTSQYQAQIADLSQKWFDKGVKYRAQGFDPWNANWSNPTQAAAAQEYLDEKSHIEALAGLAKEVSTDFTAKQKAAQENKLDGFDDYVNKIKTTPLTDLYAQGGVNALPSLHKPMDLAEVDKNYHLAPQEVQKEEQIAPGVVNKVTHKYVNIPQAASTYEQLLNNQPGSVNYFNKKGIGNPAQLYTFMGHNMLRDKGNPDDYGHIDEPGIYHQMVSQALTDPNEVKNLPDGVKQKIVAAIPGMLSSMPVPAWKDGKANNEMAAASAVQPPYSPVHDPEFRQYIDQKFDKQITKERAYQNEIIDGVARKLPSVALGDSEKTDATLANLRLHQQSVNQGWKRLGIEQQNADRYQKEYAARTQDVNSREQWVNDIQNMHPDAINTLGAAIKEVNGELIHSRGGVYVRIKEKVPNPDYKGTGDLLNPQTIYKEHRYDLNKYSGKAGRMIIMQLLNKLPSVGKEKVLKTEQYNPNYNDIGTGDEKKDDTADDL